MDNSLELKIKKLAYMSDFLKKEFLLSGQDGEMDEEDAIFMSEIESDLRELIQAKIEKEFSPAKPSAPKPENVVRPPFTSAQESVLRALADNILSKTNPVETRPEQPVFNPVPPPIPPMPVPPDFSKLPMGERIKAMKEYEKKATKPAPPSLTIDVNAFELSDE